MTTQTSITSTDVNLEYMDFEPHPTFVGVRMKHVVLGSETHGAFSSHLVQVDPGCALAPHRHPAQDEQHAILRGTGHLTLAGGARDYAAGDVAVMPRGHEHAVVAGADGLLLLATFSPPLR